MAPPLLLYNIDWGHSSANISQYAHFQATHKKSFFLEYLNLENGKLYKSNKEKLFEVMCDLTLLLALPVT